MVATSASDNLYFVAGAGPTSGNNPYTVNVIGTQNANGLNFQLSGAATFAGTGTIALGGNGLSVLQFGYGSVPQGSVTINAGIALQASQTWTNDSANVLTIGGNVANGTNTLTIGGAGSSIISGSIGNGAGGLNMTGPGTLTLTVRQLYRWHDGQRGRVGSHRRRRLGWL